MQNRIAWLDMFRGLAALMIVLYHYRYYLGWRNFELGFIAVDGFFVLSGIVLAMKYTDAIVGGMSFGSFAAVRLKRLYPMIFIAGVLIVLLNLADAPRNTYMGASPNGVWSMFLPLFPWCGSLTNGAKAAYPADVPMWSLWAELAANAVWFAVIRAGKRWMPWLGGITMVALVVVTWQYGSLNIGWRDSLDMRAVSLIRALALFSLGYWIVRGNVEPIASPLVWILALGAVFATFATGMPVTWYASLVAVAICAALLHALYAAPAPGPAVSRLAKWLGQVSFPLYLVHGPVGRLEPYFPGTWPHPVILLLLLVPAGVVATVLNERVVRLVQHGARRKNRCVRKAFRKVRIS